ncbi:MAG: DEAD/DEAH box helicase [Aquificaceae bacterium]
MGEVVRIRLLEKSFYSLNPPKGKVLYLLEEEGKLREEDLIDSSLVDERINYPLLNPLQTVFYRFYQRGNSLVMAPTSSGKSLIAYLFMKNYRGRLVYTAPTKALVKEKFVEFKSYYPPKEVEMRTGETVLEAFRESKAKLVVSTYEHLAHAFRNRSPWLEELSALVIDEVHQIGKRWILEEVITYCIREGIPMLCLSATLPGVEDLVQWISARLVIKSSWRPVPLYRGIKSLTSFRSIDDGLEGEELIAGRLLSAIFSLKSRDENLILFVPKKSLGWKILELASRERIGLMNKTLPFDLEEEREPELAFHNADVPKEEREEIERAFREGRLKWLVATQTLAYGVNLPADRVLIFVRFFRKDGELRSIPDSLDILQMEGRAGRLGIREEGYSHLLVYGAKEDHLESKLARTLNKGLTTATMEEGENLNSLAFFLLLAHMYEKDNPERYLENTYSFKQVKKEKLRKVERFLREYGYLKDKEITEKGLFCIRSGIPPTSFEEFLRRSSLSLSPMITIRPLLHTKKFDGLFSFLKGKERFREDQSLVRALSLPCGRDCIEDNTHQFLFYTEGLTARYSNLKNPPGEFSYLATDALHLLRTLMGINKRGFYKFSAEEMLKIAHSVKYGINPDYASLSGIKGIGHIRANLLREVLLEANIEPPRLCQPVKDFVEIMESEKLYEALLEKIIDYRDLGEDKAKEELKRIRNLLRNNLQGYMVDDRLLLGFGLFVEGPRAIGKRKAELVELFLGWNSQNL